jgi:hypothetical protein
MESFDERGQRKEWYCLSAVGSRSSDSVKSGHKPAYNALSIGIWESFRGS